MYHFTNVSLYKKALFSSLNDNCGELFSLLERYQEKKSFELIDEGGSWFDVDNLDHYHRARRYFLRKRFMNNFIFDRFNEGVITKESANKNKLFWEINWFNNIPDLLKYFAPRIFSSLVSEIGGGVASYSMEFYVGPLYNYLIRNGKRVIVSPVKEYRILGTPEELELFIKYSKKSI